MKEKENGLGGLLRQYERAFWKKVKQYEESGYDESFIDGINYMYNSYMSIHRNLGALKIMTSDEYPSIKDWYEEHINSKKLMGRK